MALLPGLVPDGRRLAFAVEASGSRDVYAWELAGEVVTRLTAHEADDFMPAWQP